MQEKHYLSVLMLGPDNSEILRTVSHLIAQHHCQTVNCRVFSQGEFYHFSFLLSGEWGALAKIQPKLIRLESKYSALTVFVKQTVMPVLKKNHLPYTLYLICQDDPQAFYKLMHFLHQQSVIITETLSDSYKTRLSQTPMMSITVKIQLSTELSLSDFRENFMLFCDDMNFDAIMEPEKP